MKHGRLTAGALMAIALSGACASLVTACVLVPFGGGDHEHEDHERRDRHDDGGEHRHDLGQRSGNDVR